MKHQFLTLIFGLSLAFACREKTENQAETPLAEQQLRFEIYDSLVVDYLGNLYLADISKNSGNFILIDQQTDTLLIVNPTGQILSKFSKKGDGPGLYQPSRLGPPQFFTNDQIIIPSMKGFHIYDSEGNPIRTFLPEFNPTISLINPFDNKIIQHEEKIYYPWEGRLADSLGVDGKALQQALKKLEVLDLNTGKFSPALPIPSTSKYKSTEKSYLNINYTVSLSQRSDTLFLSFRNEPVIYSYAFSDLENPTAAQKIPFPEFIERDGKEEVKFGAYEMKDIYVGGINSFQATEKNRFLISYTRGLTETEYVEIFDLIAKDQQAGYQKLEEVSTSGIVLFDGKSLSSIINQPKELGYTYVFISEDEIWFSQDYEQAEKDYLVLYKTRIVSN